MYVNQTGNVVADCVITGVPQYNEEYGVYKRELTKVVASCKENSPEGTQTVNLVLYFFSGFAIPAMKLNKGMTIVLMGREISHEAMYRGKYVLERKVVVDWWTPREIDPMGMLEELKARREIKTREQEMKETFWSWLNLAPCKELILGWIAEWAAQQRAKAATPDNKRNSHN